MEVMVRREDVMKGMENILELQGGLILFDMNIMLHFNLKHFTAP